MHSHDDTARLRSYPFNPRRQYIEELRQLDLAEYVAAWRRFLSQSAGNPAYRQFTRDVLNKPGNILAFMRAIGYGLFIGRKAAAHG